MVQSLDPKGVLSIALCLIDGPTEDRECCEILTPSVLHSQSIPPTKYMFSHQFAAMPYQFPVHYAHISHQRSSTMRTRLIGYRDRGCTVQNPDMNAMRDKLPQYASMDTNGESQSPWQL